MLGRGYIIMTKKFLDVDGAKYLVQKILEKIPDHSGFPDKAITNEEIDAMFTTQPSDNTETVA